MKIQLLLQRGSLRKESTYEAEPVAKQSRLTELLLNGPVLTEEEISTIEETHKSINQWRIEPL